MEQAGAKRNVRVIPAKKKSAANGAKSGMRRVAAYCRVSTDSEEQINSYEAQKSYYTQLIEDNPEWEMAGVYADEGLSGTSMKKRTEFNRMIAACKRGRIDMILTKSLSRFARNTVDCLDTIRILRAQGIGVIFEKENINTLTESSEFLITLFSGFAQAESESLSRNVLWGKQKSMEAGKVAFQYKKLLGYRKGADGEPEIVPEEAETIRRSYLRGASLGDIVTELTEDGSAPAESVKGWSRQVVRNILVNEKYIGDALLQKTYITDCITKKVRKNNGERPMYYVENHHAAIIPKEIYRRVQEEMERRSSKRKVMQKTAQTEKGKYSGKYAFSELLVCGECGSPYKRCTWVKKGRKRIVWRCVSRLEYGTKFCHQSPTMDEARLQRGVLDALNRYAANPEEVTRSVMEAGSQAIREAGDASGLAQLQRKLAELTDEQSRVLDQVLEDMDNLELNERLRDLGAERQRVQEQIEELQKAETKQSNQSARLRELADWLEKQPKELTEYDDAVTRRVVEKITVVNADTIRVRIRDSAAEIEARLPAQ